MMKKKNNLGNIFILVEGQVFETKILKNLFTKVFGCNVVNEKNRTNYLRKETREEILLLENSNKDLIIIKPSTYSQLHKSLSELDEYTDIPRKYGILNAAAYNTVLIFDKDIESGNKHNIIVDYLNDYNDIYGRGLLLISYPCFESFVYYMDNEKLLTVFNSEEMKKKTGRRYALPDDSDLLINKFHKMEMLIIETFRMYEKELDLNDDYRVNLDKLLEESFLVNKKWFVLSTIHLMFKSLGIY